MGQAWGAQDIEKVQSVVGSTLFMTIIGGIITAIIGVFCPRHFRTFRYGPEGDAPLFALCAMDVGR